MVRVKSDAVWQQIRFLFLGSAFLFLINIFLGFDNALTAGSLPRWQVLVHLHAGTLGWVTLSVIALAIWIHSGERDVTRVYERRVRRLAQFALVVFGCYIVAFGLAFRFAGPFFLLMPIFGIASSLAIWLAALFAITQLRQQPVKTNVHLLITVALFVAALGSTIGVLLGLEYVVGFFLPAADRIGLHAGTMDAYLLLTAATIVEVFLRKDPAQRWTWGGLLLALAWGLPPVAFILGLSLRLLPLVMASVPLLLLGLIIFLVRTGWRAFLINPFASGARPWIFFGTIWTIFWGAFFIFVIVTFPDVEAAPSWMPIVFFHAAFVGMMTNLLLAVHSSRSEEARHIWTVVEPAAMWLTNLGLVLFLGLRVAADMRAGALVMGVGVLLGTVTMIRRLWASGVQPVAAEPAVLGPGG